MSNVIELDNYFLAFVSSMQKWAQTSVIIIEGKKLINFSIH